MARVVFVLDQDDGHPMTLGRTFAASPCASLAVVVFVPLAFGGASLTDFRAHPAGFPGKMRFAVHEVNRGAAELSAIIVDAYTLGQAGGVRLAAAGLGTEVAFARTAQTCGDTSLKLIVDHDNFSVPAQTTLRTDSRHRLMGVLNDHHHRNTATLLGTLATGIRTLVAVVGWMLLALRRAQLANLGGCSTDLARQSRCPRHKFDRRAANASTVGRQANALIQARGIGLKAAVFSAILALASTANAGVDARVKICVNHVPYLRVPVETLPTRQVISKCCADLTIRSREVANQASAALAERAHGLGFDVIPR